MHVVDIHIGIVIVQTEHIHAVERLAYYNAFGTITLHKLVFHFQILRLLETELRREPLHLAAQIIHQFAGVATQNKAYILDVTCIILM